MARLLLVALWLLSGAVQALPTLESWTTGKGATVIYVAAPELPILDIRLVFDAGSARDGGLEGLASFVNSMLDEGAGDLDAQAFAARLEGQGVELEKGSLRDMAWVGTRSLTEPASLAVALESLELMVTAPRFEPQATERVRQQILAAIDATEQDADSVADMALMQALFPDHPYGHDPLGSRAAVKQIGAGDLRGFLQRYYVARNALVVLVGAIDRTTAEGMAERLTSGLPDGEHAPRLDPPAPIGAARRAIAFPSAQTHIYIGRHGIARLDPDYFPLLVGNHVLGGGGLVSLLGEEVRNKRGLSYGVHSSLLSMRSAGVFSLNAQTKGEQAEQAVSVMLETLQAFLRDGPAEKDLADAKQNLIGGFPLDLASNRKLLGQATMIGFYGYPLDWLDRYVASIESVDADRIRDAFRRRLDSQQLLILTLGGG